jgi:hypothetical protein
VGPWSVDGAIGVMVALKALFSIVTGLVLAVAGWIGLRAMATVAEEQGVALDAVSRFAIAWPGVVVLFALVAVACGIWLLVSRKGRWVVLILSTLALVAPAILLLWVMISVLAPLYTVS